MSDVAVNDRRERLRRMLNPVAAVLVGGSNLVPAIDYCRAKGYGGRLYVVNPRKDEIAGIKCYARVVDLPEVPELAFVAIPKDVVVETLRALAAFGVAGAVCNAAGFSEMEGDGVERQSAFVEAAGEMPVLGPNCPGFANFADNAVFMQDHFGDHEGVTEGVAVISNGGAYVSDMGTADRSLPIAYEFGLGNQAVVSIADVLDVVLDDARVKAVNLYIEALQDVPKLSRAAWKALQRGVPIVVVKGGRSQAGQRATQSHTASLAGDDVVTAALFERLGFLTAESPDEALETLKMLVFAPRPRGNRLAFATSSGSYAVLGADAAERAGLVIPALSAERKERLDGLLPHYISASNPLDIANGQMFPAERQSGIYGTFLDGEYDVAVQVMCFPPDGGSDPASWVLTTGVFAREAAVRGLPCVFVSTLPEALPAAVRVQMLAQGMVPLLGLRHGMRAVANGVRYGRILGRWGEIEGDWEIVLSEIVDLSGEVRLLDEVEGKGLLAEAGVGVPESILWDGEAQLDLSGLAFPVVVKGVSSEVVHKTEVGGVVLGVRSVAGVKAAVVGMQERADGVFERFLIEEMVTDGVAELLVGIRYVAGIGQALTLGFGGVGVALLQDVVTVVLPCGRPELERSLRSLKQFPLLEGWRGRPTASLEGLLEVIEQICAFAEANRERLVELEINPLIVTGDGAVAVDAVIKIVNGQ